VTLAHVFTVAGLLLFAAALLPAGRRAGAWLAGVAGALVPASVRTLGAGWDVARRRAVLAGGVLLFCGVIAAAAVAGHVPNAESVYRAAQKLYDAGRLDESAVLFHEAQRLAPLAGTSIHANYFEAIVSFRQERWREAEEIFQRLLATFPEGVNAPEALYHVGVCRLRLGDAPGAREAWEQTRARYPTSPWAKYAGDRLAEMGPAHGG
jgi:TolA-binding protein